MSSTADPDPAETKEWLEAFDAVLQHDGAGRAEGLLETLVAHTRSRGLATSLHATTPYVNTIAPQDAEALPTDQAIERRVRSLVRWNALATVLQANKESSELGGHIASFQSASTLYEVGFNHFWRAPSEEHGGDLVYIQGHSSPGIYARAFLEGRIDEAQMRRFRQEADAGQPGLSSYPHPWLMPEFWQFPTVSMGLGPLMGIYQARFLKYLGGRGMADTKDRDVWVFCGDGEMDEPESMGAIGMAGREKLDNLNFVINCNLQRLDGPVRGNGKIIQELEANFRGAGWNVIKVVWGSRWDELLAKDTEGHLLRLMEETLDGDYQTLKSRDGAYVREHFFGKHPETAKMVEDWTDEEVWALNRGGHDPAKIYAAYAAARAHKGQPTVILAKTIKGYGMGASGEGQNITHQQKKMTEDVLLTFRERFGLDLTDEQVKNYEFHRPAEDSEEMRFLKGQREKLGGYLPARRPRSSQSLPVPELSAFKAVLDGSGDREISTTMAFVRILAGLLRDKAVKKHVVPIVPDESRTFGMEGMFRQLGIFSQVGQLYQPEDSEQLMFYREDRQGQILQEGINEPGAFSSWIAAATSYSNSDTPMIPFYVYYSMFGFQRIGDLAWAAGDSRARGFLVGGTAGRTTLNGEGLQHEDGHSLVQAALIPNCVSYDPAYGYELAVIVHDGLRRMFGEQEDVFYYLTVMNENYRQPALPEGAEEGILKGIHRVREAGHAEAGSPEDPDTETAAGAAKDTTDDGLVEDDGGEAADGDAEPADAGAGEHDFDEGAGVVATAKDVGPAQVRLLGSGTILREVIAAAEMLEEDWGVAADVFSVTSYTELRRDGLEVQRHNWLHPEDEQGTPYVSEVLSGDVPVVASSDYVRELADGIRPFLTAPYFVLGTDGYGRSDYRKALRGFFEVDRRHVVLAALTQLADAGEVDRGNDMIPPAPAEFGLIARHFRPLAGPGALNLLDDAATLSPPPGRELVVTVDAMVEGVHFLPDDPPDLIARKLLRVNLSDLAAKGAVPLAYLLTLSVRRGVSDLWLTAFAAGLKQDQECFNIILLGGDTTSTPGPLSFTVTAIGHVAPDAMVRRAGARIGDAIWVSGTIGDGALGLRAIRGELNDPHGFLAGRYRLPVPRLGLVDPAFVRAAMDVSDGLVQDLGHLCRAAGLGATVWAPRVPVSVPDPRWLETCLTGGDDYELLMIADPSWETALRARAGELGIVVTRIGTIEAESGIRVLDAAGQRMTLASGGWSHS